ncbi:hypothetical protein DM01DRAFT_1160241 [Hesseltinella vesiculosa]|uniref:Secreted protein n=1 Tax=Hesseltinella vesiculosa TaxID=101127 RepID=A0A1X2GSP7_9FUNG|nr:hypothetical protein DM01DRAFT_1160241 [Hesseltinella vesiculosa]
MQKHRGERGKKKSRWEACLFLFSFLFFINGLLSNEGGEEEEKRAKHAVASCFYTRVFFASRAPPFFSVILAGINF